MTFVQKLNEVLLMFGPLYIFVHAKKLNETVNIRAAVFWSMLIIIASNVIKYMLLANCLPAQESSSLFSTFVKCTIGFLDVLALEYLITKKWIDASDKVKKVHTIAIAWTFGTLLLSNGLEIISADRGEEIEYQSFLVCISEFMKLLDYLAITGLTVSGAIKNQYIAWAIYFLRFSVFQFILESNILNIEGSSAILSIASSILFYFFTKPLVKF